MNLKKLANWSWNSSFISRILFLFSLINAKSPVFALRKQGFFDKLSSPFRWNGDDFVCMPYFFLPGMGICASSTATNISTQPRYSRPVIC